MDSKEKFTHKVENYVKYRPAYPQELISYLTEELGLSVNSVVADVGAGTGIFTKLLADKAKVIYAVEPNANMRAACERYCAGLEHVTVVDGGAEETGLPDRSVDFITSAQAFHWFDRNQTKPEFQRILKHGGKVILVWNSRVAEDELVQESDQLCRRYCTAFDGFSGGSSMDSNDYHHFFKECDYRTFENNITYTLDSYIGNSLSASYAPNENDPNYQAYIEALTELFHKYSVRGELLMPNKTHSYAGED